LAKFGANRTAMISFKVDMKEFKRVIKFLKVPFKGKKANYYKTSCELTLIDGKVTFAVPGAVTYMFCETKGTAKATLPVSALIDFIENHSHDKIVVEFLDGKINFASTSIKAQTWFFKNDAILRTIQLPINYTDFDLLKLKNQDYTKEELDFNNLSKSIADAEKRLIVAINKAYSILHYYKVKKYELRELIEANAELTITGIDDIDIPNEYKFGLYK
jgi:hypothetical protein